MSEGYLYAQLNLSWISYKDWAIMVISYVLFFLLYLSVFIANAGIIFGWKIGRAHV